MIQELQAPQVQLLTLMSQTNDDRTQMTWLEEQQVVLNHRMNAIKTVIDPCTQSSSAEFTTIIQANTTDHLGHCLSAIEAQIDPNNQSSVDDTIAMLRVQSQEQAATIISPTTQLADIQAKSLEQHQIIRQLSSTYDGDKNPCALDSDDGDQKSCALDNLVCQFVAR